VKRPGLLRAFIALAVIAPVVAPRVLRSQVLVAPVASQKTEPEYPPDLKAFLVDPARIEVQVDEKGKPFALRSASSLPDNVVQALADWRFTPGTKDGKRASFNVFLNVPIRRSMGQYLAHSSRSSFEHFPLSDYKKSAALLTPEKAADLERDLKEDRESVEGRAQLLAYYEGRNDKDAVQIRFSQISWLIRNQPEAQVLGTPAALIASGAPSTSADYDRVHDLWMDQVSRNPDNPLVLAHATYYLRKSDPKQAEELLLRVANRVSGAAAWLGDVYALAALGVRGVDLEHPEPASEISDEKAKENATHARAMLAAASDQRVILSALATLTSTGRVLNQTGNPPAAYTDLCPALLSRVQAFYPDSGERCELPAAHSTPGAAPAANIVSAAHLKRKVMPVYPPDARALRMQGTVRFSALIGKDGTLKELELLSGPLMLYGSSRKAVLQWEYEPTRINGKPVAVSTQVDVNFAMPR
jgi:hypothetical protein